MMKFGKMMLVVGVAVIFGSSVMGSTIATFDDLSLDANSYWKGAQSWIAAGSPVPGQGGVPSDPNPIAYSNSFSSGSLMSFANQFSSGWDDNYGGYSYTSWEGFAYSNCTNNTVGGFSRQFDVATGAAHSGSNFAVAFPGWTTPSTVTLVSATTLGTTQLALTSYAYYSLRDGDAFAAPMINGDWFKVTVTGKNTGAVTGSFDVYLADYRDGKTILSDTWVQADLSALGVVDSVEFSVSASDGGAQWPAYFAMDTMVPEPTTVGLLLAGGISLIMRRRK
jgi:hypothetical protein